MRPTDKVLSMQNVYSRPKEAVQNINGLPKGVTCTHFHYKTYSKPNIYTRIIKLDKL